MKAWENPEELVEKLMLHSHLLIDHKNNTPAQSRFKVSSLENLANGSSLRVKIVASESNPAAPTNVVRIKPSPEKGSSGSS